MGDCRPIMEDEENIIAALQHFANSLGTKRNLTEEARKKLADLGIQLASITRVNTENSCDNSQEDGASEYEEQLKSLQAKITSWDGNPSLLWDCGAEEAYRYLRSVEEARKLAEKLESSCADPDLLRRVHDVLQMAMARLEDEFTHLLINNRLPFEPEHMSFRSTEEDTVSTVSFGDESVDDGPHRDSMSRSSEDYVIELVHPDAVPDLKCIANLMFDANYGRECTQAFVAVRKDALDDCLYILEEEKLSIEDVQRMEWSALNSKMRRWVRTVKIFVRIYLASEKWLADQIFSEAGPAGPACFTEASKPSLLQLLNFAEAVSITPKKPERLIRVLDMYEVLADLLPEIDSLYSDDSVRAECRQVLAALGGCAKSTFSEFENAVSSNVSTNPFPGGNVHPITKYVMNYMRALMDYTRVLDRLLVEEDYDDTSSMASQFQSLLSTLELNLESKSKLYKDEALRHLFLTNNLHYIAEKVKRSELRTVLGDNWIRKCNGKFQKHARSYERATWSSVMYLIREEGVHNPGSTSVSRTLLKERLHSFYVAFEEVYKSQSGWVVPDRQLRDDLIITTSLTVIQGYRTFVGRHSSHISDKYIKYSADDLENFLQDLFEGSPKSLHGSHRK